MGIFDDAKTVMIGNKEVQSIITSNGGVIYEKPSGWSLTLTGDKSVMMTGETATLTATLTNNNVPQSGKSIIFCDANYTPFVHSYDGTYNLNRHLGNSFSIYYLPQGGTHISIDSSNLHIILTNSGLVRMSDDNHTWTNLFTTKTSLNLNNGVLFDDEGHSYDISSYDNDFTLTTVFGKGKVYFEFYGVAVTNNNGVATVSYYGKGTGDLSIQADWEGRIQSEIFVIEDCYSYDLTNYTSTMLTSLQIPNTPFELAYKSILKSNTGHNTNLNIYGVLSDGTSEVISVIGIGNKNYAGWHLSFVSNGNWEINYAPNSKPLNTEYVVKYTYDNGLHSLYVDNQLLVSATKIMNNMHDIWVGIGQSEYIKELKVKPL